MTDFMDELQLDQYSISVAQDTTLSPATLLRKSHRFICALADPLGKVDMRRVDDIV